MRILRNRLRSRHKRLEIPSLSTEQIRGIYSGKISRWKEVGGKDEPVTAHQREENSGSQKLMRTLVMKELPFTSTERGRHMPDLIARGMGGPFRLLNGNAWGLAADTPAARLREWLLSDEGQAVVRESGYVPI